MRTARPPWRSLWSPCPARSGSCPLPGECPWSTWMAGICQRLGRSKHVSHGDARCLSPRMMVMEPEMMATTRAAT